MHPGDMGRELMEHRVLRYGNSKTRLTYSNLGMFNICPPKRLPLALLVRTALLTP